LKKTMKHTNHPLVFLLWLEIKGLKGGSSTLLYRDCHFHPLLCFRLIHSITTNMKLWSALYQQGRQAGNR
jgi:hypothetical protein